MAAPRRAFALGLILVAAACTRTTAAAVPSGSPSGSLPNAAPATTAVPAPTELPMAVTESAYGTLALKTAKGAECSAELTAVAPIFGEAPPAALPAQLAADGGIVRWTYAAPRLPGSTAYYRVVCRAGAASATATGAFSVARGPMAASAFTVSLSPDTPPGESFAPVAALAPLRDEAIARMRATLPSEWMRATRGLGGVQIVERSADITIFVVAARGTSVHRTASDGSEDIVVYVEGDLGPKTVENAVATALHELGHIWCCRGPGSDGGGHWLTKERDGGLYGVDKYGLMTDPVTCVAFGAVLSCPNRFSDREMRALGFTSFPPPPPDPCIVQAQSIGARLAPTQTQLTSLGARIRTAGAQLGGLDAQIGALRAQYPNGVPPNVVAQINALIDQYNALNTQNNARIDEYNALLAESRSLGAQLNALPCDAS